MKFCVLAALALTADTLRATADGLSWVVRKYA